MPARVQFQIKGLNKLQLLALKTPDEITRMMQVAMKGAVELVRSRVARYPPATAANRPPGINGYSWYERGYGIKTRTGRSYEVSEALGRSWTTRVQGRGIAIQGIVGTRASYARPVQDEEEQAWFHRDRGWPTAQGALRDSADRIQEIFDRAVARILQRGAR